MRAGGDVVVSAVSAGGHGPELEERAAREARAEEGGEDGGVGDDVAAGQVVERPERVRQVVREADVEREQRVSEVAVREEARPRGAGVEAVAEARGQRAVQEDRGERERRGGSRGGGEARRGEKFAGLQEPQDSGHIVRRGWGRRHHAFGS